MSTIVRKTRTKDGEPRILHKVTIEGRYAKFLSGELTVDDLDDEEIIRGRLKDRNGGWSGRPPKAMPTALVEAIVAERPKRIQAMLDKEIPFAFKALHDVMVGGTANKGGGAKVAAATKILEYAIGKPTESMNLRVEGNDKRWEDILPQVFYEIGKGPVPGEPVVDAEEA